MNENLTSNQFTTFTIDGELFGAEVLKVQEVAGSPSVCPVPLAPGFLLGLINLRGQIATALGLREIFGKPTVNQESQMSVICKIDGSLISLVVDSIGDVIEINNSNFESTPDTIPTEMRKFIKGIYKMNDNLLSVLDLEALAKELSPTAETVSERSS